MHNKQIHRNLAQIKVFLINALITVVIFGRGTGKTFGVTATWVYDRARKLKGSSGAIMSLSYAHLIDTIIPEMQRGWRTIGLEEGLHYWVRETPPEILRIPQPYLPVDDPKYYIFWANGSVTKLVSQDRKALVNSKSFDYIAFCEGRKLDGKRIEDDVMPTLRGNKEHFGHLPEHHSILIESDLPKDVKGRWFLKYKKKMDTWRVDAIMKLHAYIYNLKNQKTTDKKATDAKIKEANATINEMRKDLTYVGYASTLDNIHALGIKPIKQLRRTLSKRDYEISVLNIEQDEIENCFYADLKDDIHAYEAINYDYIDKQKRLPVRNCLWDADVNPNMKLDIVMDRNLAINFMGVSQRYPKVRKLLKVAYVLAPKSHMDIAQDIADYYQPHQKRVIRLMYNHTMTAGEKHGIKSIAQEVREVFVKNGFTVEMLPLGQAMTHEETHKEWGKLFRGEKNFKFMYNRFNCETWYHACKQTGHLITNTTKGEKFKKDKRSENPNSGIPPWEATHATECVDQLLHFDIRFEIIASIPNSFAAVG